MSDLSPAETRGEHSMNAEPKNARQSELWSRRALLWRVGGTAFGTATLSLLAACGPAAAPAPVAPTSAPAAAPTSAPAAAAKPTTAAATAPTTAPAAVKPTTAAASSAAAPSGTLRYASADFTQESLDPINIESFWG